MTTTEVERARVPVAAPDVVTAADVLVRAADLLGEWDWCQGAARKGESICALGAIYLAATGYLPAGQMFDLADETLLYKQASDFFALVTGGARAAWNDREGRTKAEVVAKLREAARAAR